MGGLCAGLYLAAYFAQRFMEPFTDVVDFNGSVWSQAAHNFLRAGLGTTAGVPAAFYFGPLPIPPEGYYVHHPALLALSIAASFRVFGEHEWAARLVPVLCSLLSLACLWRLVAEARGVRAAACCVALFAALPMELHYGQMVNFEPCTLLALLIGLLGQREWEATGARGARALMVAGYVGAMWTSWLGYFFVLAFAGQFLTTGRRARMGLLLIVLALLSGLLFLLQIRCANPAAWSNLAGAFWLRLGHHASTGEAIHFKPWAVAVGRSLLVHLPAPFLLLAMGGAALLGRRREGGAAWLGRVALVFFVMNALYVILFRNASYIHNYASFYFILPVAICGGVALDAAAAWMNERANAGPLRCAGSAAALFICIALGVTGWQGAAKLLGQAYVLETEQAEPADLIPQLGRLMRDASPEDAEVLCNFDQDYTPQLCYYAQRHIVNNLTYDYFWQEALSEHDHPLAGVIWMGAPDAEEVLAVLKTGTRRPVKIGGMLFYVWQP